MERQQQAIIQRIATLLDTLHRRVRHSARVPKGHILVADDEPNIRRLIQVHLERKGFSVTTACNGVEVMEKLAHFRPDAIVLDIRKNDICHRI
jgi:PleD family two-component response regulator